MFRKVLVVVILVLVLLAVLVYLWWQGREMGALCTRDDDCNSHKCLHLTGWGRSGVCTELCQQDLDCPMDMVCGEATRGPSWNRPGRQKNRQVCIPTGKRLSELLKQ